MSSSPSSVPPRLIRYRELEVSVGNPDISLHLQLVGRDTVPQEQQEIGGGTTDHHISLAALLVGLHAVPFEADDPAARSVGLLESEGLSCALHLGLGAAVLPRDPGDCDPEPKMVRL